MINIKTQWNKKRYLIILEEFKDILSDVIAGR